jgi:acyl-CoA thioester hydrolase
VYFEDTDAGGVMYHASYLRLAERARTEALRDSGVPHAKLMAEHGFVFVVRRVAVEYLAPARLDDLVQVATRVGQVGGASISLQQVVRRKGTVLARLDLVLVCLRMADGHPVRIPQPWRDVLGAGLEKGD